MSQDLNTDVTFCRHAYLSLSTLRKLLKNILVSLPSFLVDANHLTSVTRPQNLGSEKEKESIAMKVTKPSHSAGRNLSRIGCKRLPPSQFQTDTEMPGTLPTAKSPQVASLHSAAGEPSIFISWKVAASGLCREREEWLWISGGSQEILGILPERKELNGWRTNLEKTNSQKPSTEPRWETSK